MNQQIRGRKFFRVVFLLPFMLSPVAVSFMIGKSLLNSQYGPVVPALEWLGFTDISFYEDPWLARLNIMIMDAWYSIPFMMVLLLAGLQGIPRRGPGVREDRWRVGVADVPPHDFPTDASYFTDRHHSQSDL